MYLELTKKAEKRFWSKVEIKENDCWEWKIGKTKKNGYGRFFLNGYKESAHRISLAYFKGFKDIKNLVLHTCDNPSCVNPDHLYEGTIHDNHTDKYHRGGSYNITNNKLNKECVKVIKWMLKYRNYHDLQTKLAKLYKISSNNIRLIKNNKIWVHVKV